MSEDCDSTFSLSYRKANAMIACDKKKGHRGNHRVKVTRMIPPEYSPDSSRRWFEVFTIEWGDRIEYEP
jgi:hypothetical protein